MQLEVISESGTLKHQFGYSVSNYFSSNSGLFVQYVQMVTMHPKAKEQLRYCLLILQVSGLLESGQTSDVFITGIPPNVECKYFLET